LGGYLNNQRSNRGGGKRKVARKKRGLFLSEGPGPIIIGGGGKFGEDFWGIHARLLLEKEGGSQLVHRTARMGVFTK